MFVILIEQTENNTDPLGLSQCNQQNTVGRGNNTNSF